MFQSTGEGYVEGGNISFSSGWNLLGLVYEPDESKVESVLSDIISDVVSVWKWTDNTWAVYLPAFEDGGKAYADAKGFILLNKIGGGEGFWVNAMNEYTLNFGGAVPADKAIHIAAGWNLVGLKIDESVSIDSLIEGNEEKILSIWKWSGNNWAVYLPVYGQEATQNYANAKGFEVLTKINPGEGFWINSKESIELKD